jgi:Na+/melibiose symporter-like transporter
MTDRLPGHVRTGYAAGSLATGAFSTVPGLLLLPYLTDTVGVGAALAGVLVLLPKAWDVIFNPIAGRLSDAHTGPRGPRRPFLLYGGLATAVLFAAMFAHPPVSTVGVMVWVVLLFLLTATAYALYQVPYVALPAEMTHSPAERTRLMTRRIAVLAVAILAAGAGAPAIRDAVGGVNGYRLMGLAIGALIAIGALWSYFGTARAPVGKPLPSAVGYRETITAVRAAPRFGRLWIVFVIQAVGIGTMLAGVDYVARVVLGRPGASSILFAAFVGPALLVMPVWQLTARRYSKVACYVAASVLLAAGAIGLLVTAMPAIGRTCITVAIAGPDGLDHGVCSVGGSAAFGWTSYTPLESGVSLGPPLVVVIALVVVIGVGYAGQQVFPLSLLADFSAEAETETGGKRAGVFAGVWTAGETFGMALGPGIYGVVLALGSYVSLPGAAIESTPATVALLQPQSAAIAIIVGFTLIPALCVLAPLPLLRKITRSPGAQQL